MIRYLNEAEVREMLTMPKAIERVERAFRDRAEGKAFDTPRRRTRQPGGILHILQAAAPELNVIGYKAYYVKPTARTFFVHLLNYSHGNPEAIIEADWLGMMRTGGATGVATNYLARKDASVVACFGTGHHAITQLQAVAAVRRLAEVRAVGRNPERLKNFCDTMSRQLGVVVRPAQSDAAALDGAHIVNIMTRAETPLFDGNLLAPGQHVNAAGANALNRREIDLAAIKRCDVIAVDSRDVARGECGDLLPAFEQGLIHWENVPELGEIIVGCRPGRTADSQITLFESHGMGIQDIYTGHHLLEIARQRGIGVDLPIGQSPRRTS